LSALVLLLTPLAGDAEFYKYKDETGALRFTDDLTEVPPDQRPKVKSYEEPADYGIGENESEKETASEEEEGEGGMHYEAQSLYDRKDKLDSEYKALMKERQSLARERLNLKTQAEREAYNAKAQRLNEKISDFENRRSAFQKEVEKYNKKVKP
jgi:chromosome segregation ATPase